MSSVPPPPLSLVRRAMDEALAEAEQARRAGEVPVGATVWGRDGRLLGRACNRIEADADPTAHAERLALAAACTSLGRPRLPEGSLVAVTLEPCAMCAGAIVLARPSFLVFGALDPKAGACGSLRDVVRDPRLNHRVRLLDRQREAACAGLLTAFFRARRRGQKGGGRQDPGCL